MALNFKPLTKQFTGWGKEGTTFVGRATESKTTSAMGWLVTAPINGAIRVASWPVAIAKGAYNNAPGLTLTAGTLATATGLAYGLKRSEVPKVLAPEAGMAALDPNMVAANVNQALELANNPAAADAVLMQADPRYGQMLQASNQIMASAAQSQGMMMSPEQIQMAQLAEQQAANR